MSRFTPVALLLAVAGGGTGAWAQADDVDTFDRTPVDCVIVNNIRRTEILDDQTIVFHMRGSRIFLNHLPRSCPTLEREERFAYRTSGGRLCAVDTITVIERTGFGGGFTCPLGQFHPVTVEEIQELREGPSGVEVSPAEVPEDD
jgi:hypothetical protein